MEKKYKIMMLAFSGVPFIMVLGNSMLIPEFPQIKAALNISQFQVGLFITAFSISAGITIPFLGYLCDQIGRIKIIVPALLLYGAGGIISGLALCCHPLWQGNSGDWSSRYCPNSNGAGRRYFPVPATE